jgi:hypothetical protein
VAQHVLGVDDSCAHTHRHLRIGLSFTSWAQALVERHMLGVDEERALLAALPVPPADRWLQLLYQCAPFSLPDVERSAVRAPHHTSPWRAPRIPFPHAACGGQACTAYL